MSNVDLSCRESPSYVSLWASGELRMRADRAIESLSECRICPRQCGVDRLHGERGFCRSGSEPVISSWNLHPWEEPPISGVNGSGTIFFGNCTGRCVFCQNYPISQLGVGNQMTVDDLADIMLELQQRGAHNINLVTATHFFPQVLSALDRAIPKGLRIPLVYNSSGYETVATLRLLEEIVDIYLPDAKYADDQIARDVSGFVGYVENNHRALREIHRQVGSELITDANGIARKGMIVRHLVLPDNLSGSEMVLRWIVSNLSSDVYISLMDQYFPAHKAIGHPVLGRKITPEEYESAIEAFYAAGLING